MLLLLTAYCGSRRLMEKPARFEKSLEFRVYAVGLRGCGLGTGTT